MTFFRLYLTTRSSSHRTTVKLFLGQYNFVLVELGYCSRFREVVSSNSVLSSNLDGPGY